MRSFFFQDALDFLAIWVILQSLRGKNLQLEWVGSHFSANRLASYFQTSPQLAGCFMLCFWKTETYRHLPHKAAGCTSCRSKNTFLSASACARWERHGVSVVPKGSPSEKSETPTTSRSVTRYHQFPTSFGWYHHAINRHQSSDNTLWRFAQIILLIKDNVKWQNLNNLCMY